MSAFCKPEKITVPPGRIRPADPVEVEAMAVSMKEVGQLQPILVDKDWNLLAGLHRLKACQKLGRDVWFATEEEGSLILNSPMLRRMAEYQENFRRKEFTPAEKNTAIAEIDRMMRGIYGSRPSGPGISTEGWTQTDTAKKMGIKSHRTVSDAIAITKAIEKNVPGVKEAKTTQEAIGIVKKTVRLEAAVELAKRRHGTEDDEIQDPFAYFSERLLLGNCLDKMKALPNGMCSLFITDPPFGIGMDKVLDKEAVNKATGSYSDNEYDILNMIKEVIKEMARVGKPSCQIVMFCGIQFWHVIRDWMTEAGFSVNRKPFIWIKATKVPFHITAGRTSNPALVPASSYESMVYAWRGGAKLYMQGQPDVFIHPPVPSAGQVHVVQRPTALMEEIIARFWHPGTNPLLIDPFAGSGSTLVAARRVGLRQYFGYELSPTNRERGIAHMVDSYMKELEGAADNQPTIEMGDFD